MYFRCYYFLSIFSDYIFKKIFNNKNEFYELKKNFRINFWGGENSEIPIIHDYYIQSKTFGNFYIFFDNLKNRFEKYIFLCRTQSLLVNTILRVIERRAVILHI